MSAPTPEQIRDWDATIRAGGSVPAYPGDFPYICAVVRRVRGLGIDETSENGTAARAYVDEVLS